MRKSQFLGNLFSIIFLSFLLTATTFELPDIVCPQYFRFEQHENETIGIFHPRSTFSNGTFSIKFSAHDASRPLNFIPYKNQNLTEYLIRFNNSGPVPNLIKITRNDDVICESNTYQQYDYNTVFSISYGSKSANRKSINTIPDVHRFNECGLEGLVPTHDDSNELEHGRFPWLSAIYLDSSTKPTIRKFEQKCSATLVSLRSVITAAHCVFHLEPDKIRVYLGRHNLSIFPENGAILKEVVEVLIHPDYTHHIIPEADIAILTISSPVTITQFIRPICIWRTMDSIESENSEKGSVAGWGIDEHGNKPKVPRVFDVNTVSHSTCLRRMISASDYLTERTLCAGNSDHHGPCLGDSGGGLMMKRNNRWLLRAVISLGSTDRNQCEHNMFVIYCDLAKHIDWIQKNII